MTESPLPTSTYNALREEITAILTEGRAQSHQATEWERVDTYWNIGNAIYVRALDRGIRAEYGQEIVLQLAADLDLSDALLHDLILFRKTFNMLSSGRELAWSHYRVLIRLPSVEQRRFYERTANLGHWSVRRLKEEIEADHYQTTRALPEALRPGEDPFGGRPLRTKKGQLYTYCIRAKRATPGSTDPTPSFLLDLGFRMRWQIELPGLDSPQDGMTVTATREGSGATARYRFHENREHRRKLFTYPAEVIRVIDGDTLAVVLDCGFRHESKQTLRLRGINTPELGRLAGQRAKDFVGERMDSVDFVVVSTSKAGKYGRYIADLHYLPGEPDPEVVLQRGIYLNRELLVARLAVRYLD